MRTDKEKAAFAYSVSRKAKAMYHPHAQTIRDIVYWLHVWQPNAIDIRSEGKCDICKQPKFCSYVLREHYRPTNNGDEMCGFYCGWCGWGIAGRRPIVDDVERVEVRPK